MMLAGRGRGKIRPPRRVSHDSVQVIVLVWFKLRRLSLITCCSRRAFGYRAWGPKENHWTGESIDIIRKSR